MNEQLPLVIDDVVRFTGEVDASAFLDVLAEMKQEQIVLLTSDSYLKRALDARSMAYNSVAL